MEYFQVPVSAVISIVVCCFAIAVTFVNPSLNQEPTVSHSVSQKAYYSTSGERLLSRFLMDENAACEAFSADMRLLYGDRADEEILKTVLAAIPHETKSELRGKLYTLKGVSLMNSGSREEAIESLKMALNFDPFNKTASETLNTLYGVGGGQADDDPPATVKPDK